MSAVRCFQCRNGFLLQSEINDLASDWLCNRCGSRLPHKNVNEVLTTIEKQVECRVNDTLQSNTQAIDPLLGKIRRNWKLNIGQDKPAPESMTKSIRFFQTESDTPLSIETMEEMLFHYQKLLHPNNYLIMDIMHNLVHIYAGKESLTRPEKERKIQLCHIVLDVLGRVDPGFTTWRGTLIQEMIHTLMMISKEDHTAARITEKEFHRRLNFCSRKLREAKLCLNGGFTPLEIYLKEQEQQMDILDNVTLEKEKANRQNTWLIETAVSSHFAMFNFRKLTTSQLEIVVNLILCCKW